MRVFPRLISTELLAVAGLGLAAGLIVGVGITSAFYISRASSLSADLANKTVRVRVLESLITADASSFSASSLLSTDPAPSVLAAAQSSTAEPRMPVAPPPGPVPTAPRASTSASAQASVPSQALAESPVSPRSPAKIHPSPAPVPATRAASPPPAPIPTPPSPPVPSGSSAVPTGAPPPPSPAPRGDTPAAVTQPRVPPVVLSPAESGVAPEEVAASIARNPVVGVSADRLGVARVETGGVRMRSGTFIAVGQRFSNGERLLQVDPENNRIVTSDRQLLVFFPGS